MKYVSGEYRYEHTGSGWAVMRGESPGRVFYMVEEHAKLRVILENHFLEEFYSDRNKIPRASGQINLFFEIMRIRHERGLPV